MSKQYFWIPKEQSGDYFYLPSLFSAITILREHNFRLFFTMIKTSNMTF